MSRSPLRAAVVLAAGRGEKFWPYNVVRNKCAFPIANLPTVRRLVDDLAGLGIERIVVVVGHGEPSVRASLHGCDVRFVRQSDATGTAAAALLGAGDLDEELLVVAGDLVTGRENLVAIKREFEEQRPLAAALVQPLGNEPPQNWIVAHTDGAQLRRVEGHPRSGRHRLAGVYALSGAALGYLRDNPGVMCSVPVGGMPPIESEIGQSLQMMLDDRAELLAVETRAYHIDMDKPWHIDQANEAVISAMSGALEENIIPASSRVHDGAEIHGRLVLGENCTIGNRVVVKGDLWLGDGAAVTNGAIIDGPVVVGRETQVRDYCYLGGHTTVGARGVYGHGAEFTGVALDTVYCYHYCEIWGVVGEAVDFGAATVCGNLRFDDSETVWRIQGRAERPTHAANAAYFGDFCRTGVNAIIMPGRRIGVYSCIGPGVIVYDDVPDRQLVMVKQELTTKPWGPERYGW